MVSIIAIFCKAKQCLRELKIVGTDIAIYSVPLCEYCYLDEIRNDRSISGFLAAFYLASNLTG